MIIYIEQVLIDNMVVNYFLLWFCSALLGQEKSKARLVFASFVGTAFAFVFPLFELSQYISIFLKISLGALIILTAFKYKNLRQFVTNFVTFVIATFLLGGVVLGLIVNLFSDFQMQGNSLSYTSSIPIGVFLLFGFLLFKVFYDLVLYVQSKGSLASMSFDLLVHYKNNIIKIKAFLDTGNLLVDSKTKLPIIVVNFSAFKDILALETEDFLLGNYNIKNSRYQKIETANKQGKMLLFEVDKVVINNQKLNRTIPNAVLGLSMVNFSKSTGCQALIGFDLVKSGE
jgi:stage II sporulation protein GA (sporulation sigma-E factor processing peptidase)